MATEHTVPQIIKRKVRWEEVFTFVQRLSNEFGNLKVYGVPKNGLILSALCANAGMRFTHSPTEADLIIDDIVDTGKTKKKYVEDYPYTQFRVMFDKKRMDECPWIQMPWEEDCETLTHMTRVVEALVPDFCKNEDMHETPSRWINAMTEMLEGYNIDPTVFVKKAFDVPHDNLIVVKGIRFASLCEHHLLPFTGTADVCYLPDKRIIGLSKIPRIVHAYARRVQVQERLTDQIGQFIMQHVQAKGCGVIVRGRHECLRCRGAKQSDVEMITSSMLGELRQSEQLRNEFLSVVH